MKSKADAKLVLQTVRLFADDIREIQKIAEFKRSRFQTELRQLVHRALTAEKRLPGVIR